MENQKIIDSLNKMIEQEHACTIRYLTHAAVLTGPYAETVATRLREIANDETMHAERLRERVVALDGTPSMQVNAEALKPATTLPDIISINIAEEKQAIAAYTEIMHQVSHDYVILYKTLEELINDEEQHVEELENLQS